MKTDMTEDNIEKRALVIRLGAYGDMIIITPALKKLKELGYYVILNTNERGKEVLQGNTNVDEYIWHDEKAVTGEIHEHWEKMKKEIPHDLFINFSESIECNVALHPISPMYIYPKNERFERCNKNYYDVTEKWAGIEGCQKRGEMFFTDAEIKQAKLCIKDDKYNILWALSGSGKQKVYPWADYVMGELLNKHKDIHFITVGDFKCKLLESTADDNITNLSGKISMRLSACLTQFVDLVVAPDTGVLHAAGCYDTPKIGLLGHTTKENITKHFINDFSIEADCACAPCFRLIYDSDIQCPVDPLSRACWCMAQGISPEVVYERIEHVYNLKLKGDKNVRS